MLASRRTCLAVGGAPRGVAAPAAVRSRSHANSSTTSARVTPRVSAPLTAARGATSTAGRVGVVARFKVEGTASVAEGLLLPLEYQQLLGFPAGVRPKDSDINTSYESMFNTPLPDGYSSELCRNRAELLGVVKASLFQTKGRSSVAPTEVYIPPEFVRVALAVMAEVGLASMVLPVGEQLLASSPLPGTIGTRDDVLLSMAFAYCDLAGAALENSDKASVAVYHLEEAAALLHGSDRRPLAPRMIDDIARGLLQLRAPSVLEELQGADQPSEGGLAGSERRKRAVRSLREMLKAASTPAAAAAPGAGARGALGSVINSLRPASSAASSVMGAPAAGASAAASADAGALPEATVRRLVAALSCDELVHLLEWQAVAKAPGGHPWLYPGLLDTVSAAYVVAGFRHRQPAYVRSASAVLTTLPASSEVLLLRGLCQLLLGQIDAAADDVAAAERAPPGHATPVSGWGPGAHAFIVAHSPRGYGAAEDEGPLPGLCLLAERWLAEAAFPAFSDTQASPPSASLSAYFDDTRVEALIADFDERKSETTARAATTDGARAATDAVSSAASGLLSTASTRGGALWWALPRGARLGAAVAAVALVAAGVASVVARGLGGGDAAAAAARAAVPDISVQLAQAAKTPRGSAAAARALAPLVAERLERGAAEQLIRGWQASKQACLGPARDTSSLGAVLTGGALRDARAKSSAFLEQGAYMVYKLHRCEVLDVAASPVAGHSPSHSSVTVTALLDESAAMVDKEGCAADSYRSTYRARYVAERSDADGAWRITKIVV
ncbi:hypothetical protein FOA52_011611 [Chlamydomonas sp. UWO 241]|nr:hypothetical protein FOA52_011611 [Chlamydomonas sp. UWO 241]